MQKEIKFTKHSLKQAKDRGATLEEIKETIVTSQWIKERFNRFSAVKVFKFEEMWEGVSYKKKEVRVILTEEDDKIIVITAITRFFENQG